MSYQTDLSQSQADFLATVWPSIRETVGGGEIIPVESVFREQFATDLDRKAGIDYWQNRDDGMRGLAVRIQYGAQPWATFTIRSDRTSGAETEFAKRLAAIHAGMLIPHLTIQAYIDKPGGSLLAWGIARTTELFTHFENCSTKDFTIRRNPEDDNQFIAIWWDALRAGGITVGTFVAPNITLHSRW